jgi:hypothetical protein
MIESFGRQIHACTGPTEHGLLAMLNGEVVVVHQQAGAI